MNGAAWKQVALRVKRELKDDRVASVAAGVAFFGVLALFPALIALVSLYGLLSNPEDVERQVRALGTVMPGPAQEVVGARLRALVSSSAGQLSFGLIVSVLIALWTASSGTKALIEAVQVAYDEPPTRGFFGMRALALSMAVLLVVFGVIALGMIAVLPAAFEWAGFGRVGRATAAILRWPLLALATMFGLSLLYRYAPQRKGEHRSSWMSAGAVVATLLWVAASLLLSLYVSSFGNFDATYGALAGAVLLMLWIFVTTLSILVGAEINAEIERQSVAGSTVGPARPRPEPAAPRLDRFGESRG